jgi:hypothetical protein
MPVAELGEGLLVRLLNAMQSRMNIAIGGALLVADRNGRLSQVAAVGVAEAWNRAQIDAHAGPVVEAASAQKAVIADPFDLRRHPDLARLLDVTAPQVPAAVLAIPNTWTSGTQLITVVYLSDSPTDADLAVVGRYEPLMAYALGLLEYCGEAESQAEHMVRMVQTRQWIEQAKGMIMTRRSVGPDDAFAILVEHSQTSNVKVRELSTALVAQLSGAPATDVSDEARTAAEALWRDVDRGG